MWPRSTPSLLRTTTVKDLAEMFPERFNNKTNGVTPRRWLLLANPALAAHDYRRHRRRLDHRPRQLSKLKPLADDNGFPRRVSARPSARPKSQFADWLKSTSGQMVDPDTIFDCQVKRIHEYKRQLLNALRIVVLYNRLRENPDLEMAPRTFFFAGKAAPAYHLAKLIIKFINNLAGTIDGDPAMRGRLKVVFLPEYCVSLAERLIPASDVSNQISTAGYEASGTSNMKFMMNGALTIGTRDGATIEMAEEAGEENFFLFGLTAEQVADSRGWYNPHWHYDNEPETRAALDLIFSDHFSRYEPGIFAPLRDTLLTHGDHYMHLADLKSYLEADQQACRVVRRPRRLGAQGHFERGRLRKILQRPHHRPIRGRNLECEALSGTMRRNTSDMTISPLAGKPAPKEMLVDLARLERDYFERRPDLDDPEPAGQLRHQRASRLAAATARSPRRTSSPSRRPSATTGRSQGTDGPLYMGKDTHALSGPAQRTALEVLAANGVETIIQRDDGVTPTPVISHAILVHNRGRRRASRRRHRHYAVAQPAGGWRLQVQPDQRRAGRHRRDAMGRGPRQRTCCADGNRRREDGLPFDDSAQVRERRTRKISSCPMSTICATSSTWRPFAPPGSSWASTRSAAPQCITGSRSTRSTSSTSTS